MTRIIYASTHNADMLYLVKMGISDPFFCIEREDKKFVFLDKREFSVFQDKNTNPDIEAVSLEPILKETDRLEENTSRINKLALCLLRAYGDSGHVEVTTNFPLDMADFLRLKGVVLVPVTLFCPQRMKKSVQEKEQIQTSIQHTEEVFRFIEQVLQRSVVKGDKLLFQNKLLTSEFLKKGAEHILLNLNMQSAEGIIISCGSHAAIPHHCGTGVLLPHQPIVCDVFPRDKETGYFGDMTRTYVKGSPQAEVWRMYNAVLNAQEDALSAVGPGVRVTDVHEAACRVFREHGFDVGEKGFIHSTGHGLGLEVHEEPYIKAGLDTNLEVGHVITIEPGLYYPNLGGVRIEDVVYVTTNGCENLTQHPKELVIP